MSAFARAEQGSGGRLDANIMYFARVLRAAGLPVGPERSLAALAAVQDVGLERRDDFYWALHAVLVSRREQREIFDQAFQIFWRNPHWLEKTMSLVLPPTPAAESGAATGDPMARRLAEALSGGHGDTGPEDREAGLEVDASLTFSSREALHRKDFESMSRAELAAARRAMARMRSPAVALPTRRYRPDRRGARIDMRASLRQAVRTGGGAMPLCWRSRRRRPPPLVMICDISGSMDRYARMVLHFMHAVSNDRDRVHGFVFGTRLTNISRQLRRRDVDDALNRVADRVVDWAGGTRIGACLASFNRDWSRRVLGQGAVVLLISDGLDRDAATGLGPAMERLRKSCRSLIWLNPLLRYDGYAPRAQGARVMVRHVDIFRTVHNLESLAQLADIIERLEQRNREARP